MNAVSPKDLRVDGKAAGPILIKDLARRCHSLGWRALHKAAHHHHGPGPVGISRKLAKGSPWHGQGDGDIDHAFAWAICLLKGCCIPKEGIILEHGHAALQLLAIGSGKAGSLGLIGLGSVFELVGPVLKTAFQRFGPGLSQIHKVPGNLAKLA